MREDISIAIIAPTDPEDFFDVLWQGVWEATFDLAAFGVQVQDLTTERFDVAGQEEILRQLLDDPVDSIAILPAHASALNALIDEHESRGTAVLTFHSDAPESRRGAFVGPNPFQSGVLAGEVLAKLMGERGRIVCFPGSLEKHHLSHRYEGFRAELASHPECFYEVAPLADSGPVPASSPDLLKTLRCADGIYVGHEQLVDVAALLEDAGVSAPCIGFGNIDAVQPFLTRKTESAIIDQHRYLQGYFAVQKAYDALLKREKGEMPEGVQIASDVAFAANAASEDSMRGRL